MAEFGYTKRTGDRREGRALRTLNAYGRIAPYIQRRRTDAACALSDSVEVAGIEKWLREKRAEGWAGLGFLHLLIAAYVRTVSMRPGINRFVSGRRIYARNDIQVILPVKRGASASATGSCVKVSFSPTDTVFDVYRRVSEAVDTVKADVAPTEAERLASTLMRLPRPLLRLVMAAARVMDYFDWLPLPRLPAGDGPGLPGHHARGAASGGFWQRALRRLLRRQAPGKGDGGERTGGAPLCGLPHHLRRAHRGQLLLRQRLEVPEILSEKPHAPGAAPGDRGG